MENVLQVRNEYRKQQWVQIIQDCQSSGRKYATNRGDGNGRGHGGESVYPFSRGGTDVTGGDGCRDHSGSTTRITATMIDLSRVCRYYVACGYTDLRRGIDGLAAIVSQQYGEELREDSLFLFCGRRTDRIKALYYSGDGYVLLYKRLVEP